MAIDRLNGGSVSHPQNETEIESTVPQANASNKQRDQLAYYLGLKITQNRTARIDPVARDPANNRTPANTPGKRCKPLQHSAEEICNRAILGRFWVFSDSNDEPIQVLEISRFQARLQ